jgi:hypothetical protein
MSYKKISNNFENAKIYCLSSPYTTKLYIGSTCLPLPLRLRNHKELYRQYLNGSQRKTTAFKIFDHGDVVIETIEDCSYVCCKKALLKRERFWIENNDCVNKNIPSRTAKESSRAHYENHKEEKKQYYLNNREKRLQYAKDYINNHKDKYNEYQREYRNKIKLLKEQSNINSI